MIKCPRILTGGELLLLATSSIESVAIVCPASEGLGLLKVFSLLAVFVGLLACSWPHIISTG